MFILVEKDFDEVLYLYAKECCTHVPLFFGFISSPAKVPEIKYQTLHISVHSQQTCLVRFSPTLVHSSQVGMGRCKCTMEI